MQLPLTDARAIRMIVALLAAADPLGRVERGQDPDSYAPLAAAVLAALQHGADDRRLMTVVLDQVPDGAPLEVVHLPLVRGFAEATTDWWTTASSRWREPVAI